MPPRPTDSQPAATGDDLDGLPVENWRQRLGRLFGPGMMRYRQVARGLTLGVRALVLDGEGRVFLVKHSYTPGWYLPGGGVEPGESADEALTRELWEEGRIRPDAPPILYGLYHNGSKSGRDHVALYLVKTFSQPEVPRPDVEIAAHLWAPWSDLPHDATPATRRRIDEAVRGFPVRHVW